MCTYIATVVEVERAVAETTALLLLVEVRDDDAGHVQDVRDLVRLQQRRISRHLSQKMGKK